MPDLTNRQEFEKRLERELAKASAQIVTLVIAELGTPPDPSRITPQLLQNIHTRYGEALARELAQVFIEAARGMSVLGTPFDMAAIEAQADVWAAEHTRQLLEGMQRTSLRNLERTIRSALLLGLAADALSSLLATRIARVFGRTRAENVSITEVTTATTAGEQAVIDALRAEGGMLVGEGGMRFIPYWHTQEDERVCPICAPRNGKRILDGVFPPAHPRCRCWVEWKSEPVTITVDSPFGAASITRRS